MAQISHHPWLLLFLTGGLGIIASGGMTGDSAGDLNELRKLTDKPFAVNVMLMLVSKSL